MAKLHPEVKALWLTALRSGTYPQSSNRLRDSVGFCCLGVLTDQYVKAKGLAWEEGCGGFSFAERCDFLPAEVRTWAGIPDGASDEDNVFVIVPYKIFDEYDLGFLKTDPVPVSALNDAGVPFSIIADLIEEQL